MSRRKRRVVPTSIPAASTSPGSLPWAVLAALVLAGVPFVLGKYMELNSPDPFDSGAYVYSARHVLEGARLYVDEAASAQPGTLMVNLIGVALFGFSETGPKLIQGLLQVSAFVLMFYTMRRLYSATAAVVSTAIAAIYLSAPIIAKYGNVKEQHMIAFMIIAACCYLLYRKSDRWWLAVCSAAAAVNAYYFKPTGISIVFAIAVYALAQPFLKCRSWRDTACDFMLLISGAIIGLIPLAALHIQQGQSEYFLATAPVRGILTAIAALSIALLAVFGVRLSRRYGVWQGIRQVSPRVWIGGAVAVFLVTAPLVLWGLVYARDPLAYLADSPFVKAFCWVRWLVVNIIVRFRMMASYYIGTGWAQTSFSKVAPQILRYYGVLFLPIALATAGVLTAFARWLWRRLNKEVGALTEGFVLLLAVWWVLDMAFVWISPRSYEQYYLPLNASAAMLAGYVAGLFARGVGAARVKMPWIIGGGAGIFMAIVLAWPIFAGQTRSPDTGADYGEHRRGYAQRLQEASQRRDGLLFPWEQVGDYIRANSSEEDPIYVWGWFPGIYVRAQRFCPAPNAFESEMHVLDPGALRSKTLRLLDDFAKDPPRFIVDSRKRHFPSNRPPLELWPRVPAGFMGAKNAQFLSTDPQAVAAYEQAYFNWLKDNINLEEAQRFRRMAPFRNYVMANYSVVGMFGDHVLFVRKTAPAAP